MQHLLVLVMVLLMLVTPSWAGLDEGRAAYARGDYATAFREFLPLAEQGNATAQLVLGHMYFEGRGVSQDYAKAAQWYHQAALHGSPYAQYNLGVMYDEGTGVPQDAAMAVQWYRRAAEQGLADAQTSLGVMYFQGHGVPQDFVAAVQWSRRAAEQGQAKAQFNLGKAYAKGIGVPQDYVQGHLWVNLAASRLPPGEPHDEAVRLRNSLTESMTPEQLARAQEMARTWQPKLETPEKPSIPVGQSAIPFQPTQLLPFPTTVQTVQRLLTVLGYDPGPVDGLYGLQTRAALQAFQRRAGLPLSDELTPELVNHLTTAVAGGHTTTRSPAQRP
jgi:hypothetical protein